MMKSIGYVMHIGKGTVYDMQCEKCGYTERVLVKNNDTIECGQCAQILPVIFNIRFSDLFTDGMPHDQRRIRWDEWANVVNQESIWLSVPETCNGCVYNDKGWCNLEGYPCTYNPILTPNTGMIGLACMGAGRKIN